MAEEKMHWTLSFLLRGEKNQPLISPHKPTPAGTKPGNTHRMKHALRSPLTGRFIAKRSTGADLVDAHNKATYKRRLWDWMDAVGAAVLFGMVGFMTVWAIALVLGVCK